MSDPPSHLPFNPPLTSLLDHLICGIIPWRRCRKLSTTSSEIWLWAKKNVPPYNTARYCNVKGILHQKTFYRLNLIFWIVMGCGIARFGRRGLKTTETWKFWSQNLSPGVLRRGAPGVSRHSTRCAASKPLGTKFETKIFKFRWFLGPSDQNELYHTPLLFKIWDLGDRNFFGGGSLWAAIHWHFIATLTYKKNIGIAVNTLQKIYFRRLKDSEIWKTDHHWFFAKDGEYINKDRLLTFGTGRRR